MKFEYLTFNVGESPYFVKQLMGDKVILPLGLEPLLCCFNILGHDGWELVGPVDRGEILCFKRVVSSKEHKLNFDVYLDGLCKARKVMKEEKENRYKVNKRD